MPEIKRRGKPVVRKKKLKKRYPDTVPLNVKRLIASSITDLADENGWAYLGDVGNLILKKQPDFDPRNFGFAKLTPLINHLILRLMKENQDKIILSIFISGTENN